MDTYTPKTNAPSQSSDKPTITNCAVQNINMASGINANVKPTPMRKQERKVIGLRLPLDLFTSDKGLLLRSQKDGDRILQTFIFLLTLAAKAGYGGTLMITADTPYSIADIASLYGGKTDIVKSMVATLIRYGYIGESSERYYIKDFDSWVLYTAPPRKPAKKHAVASHD